MNRFFFFTVARSKPMTMIFFHSLSDASNAA
jgi:hypothetical protein